MEGKLSNVKRPPLRYFGGKWRIAPWVIEHFPVHKKYVEPFGGGGSVLLRKTPSAVEVYNDLDSEVFQFFRVLRSPQLAAKLVRLLKRTPYSREELLAAFERSDDPVEQARRLIIRSQQAFHPRAIFASSSSFSTRGGNSGPAVSWSTHYRSIPLISQRLRRVVIENTRATKLIQTHDGDDTLFYVDPPYVKASRSSEATYRHEMSDAEHVALLEQLAAVQGYVVISGYNSELYSDLLSGWESVTTTARVSNSKSKRTEVLWLSPRVRDKARK